MHRAQHIVMVTINERCTVMNSIVGVPYYYRGDAIFFEGTSYTFTNLLSHQINKNTIQWLLTACDTYIHFSSHLQLRPSQHIVRINLIVCQLPTKMCLWIGT